MSELKTLHSAWCFLCWDEVNYKKTKTQYRGIFLNKKVPNEHTYENKYSIFAISNCLVMCSFFVLILLLDYWLSSCGCSSAKERSAWLLQVGDAGDWSENTISSRNQRIPLAFPHWQEMEADCLPLVCNFFSKSMVCGTFLKEKK